jgi:hypothetical protein
LENKMIAKIPVTAEAAQTFVTPLGDLKYRFDIRFNDRSGVWTLDLTEDASGTILFQGSPLLVGEDLLSPYNYNIGTLTVIDTTVQNKDATAEDFGSRVMLYWVSPDEVL